MSFKVPSAPAPSHKRPSPSSSISASSSSKRVRLQQQLQPDDPNTTTQFSALLSQLRKTVRTLSQQTELNIQQRNKYPHDPTQWLPSELSMHESLKQLQNLIVHNELYETIATATSSSTEQSSSAATEKIQLFPLLSQLLSHENVDIVMDVIDLFIEFTERDADVDNRHKHRMKQLLNSIFDPQLELISSLINLLHMFTTTTTNEKSEKKTSSDDDSDNEKNRIDRSKQSLILQIIENLYHWDSSKTIEACIAPENKFLEWIMNELSRGIANSGGGDNTTNDDGANDDKRGDKSDEFDELHAYVCELLAILTSSSSSTSTLIEDDDDDDDKESGDEKSNEIRVLVGKQCEVLLEKINHFRLSHKPKSMDEEEMIHNIFDCLCSCLMAPSTQDTLNKVGGLELLILVTRQCSKMRHDAIKTLSYALLNHAGNCKKFVEVGGHATLFAVWMKIGSELDQNGNNKKDKKTKKKRKKSKSAAKEMEIQEMSDQLEEHVISILVSLLTHLSSPSFFESHAKNGDATTTTATNSNGNEQSARSEQNDEQNDGQQAGEMMMRILMGKFLENRFEKVHVLMHLFKKYYARVYVFDQQVESGVWDQGYQFLNLDEDEREELLESERLKAGLFVVQRLCIIIAFLYAGGDEHLRQQLTLSLSQLNVDTDVVYAILKDAGYGVVEDSEEVQTTEVSSSTTTINMAVECLQRKGMTEKE